MESGKGELTKWDVMVVTGVLQALREQEHKLRSSQGSTEVSDVFSKLQKRSSD